MHTAFTEAWTAFVQALSFTGRHYLVVAGFGILVSAQRFLSVGGEERFAWAGGIAGEAFTTAVRLLFVLWLVRTLFTGSQVPWSQVWPRVTRFAEAHTGMLLASAVLLVALTLVAKVLPAVVAGTLAADAQASFAAWELAVKNVTVIPFTLVWMTTIVHIATTARVPTS
ncbi:hypothetical protein LEP48_13435 [Isoptericola sp. NEAU-Y5]|uniref:Cytochrome b561 bacterial/Ni-hydrogenase domain-containing protein n=1 Tax=Isoptericola luteus TaxID=2879484 RepID=A0ABS7ZIN0_9MICO|nr:hypothetical protein [Isoptericola sp. NEAU-Y5]MCA5894342.1 hypothetical protein [Isoptericola sp. NEAU-Y5]